MELRSRFSIGRAESSSFKYIGLEISSELEGIVVSQRNYISALSPMKIFGQQKFSRDKELSDKERREYRALLGQLCWISAQTQPHIAFDVCDLAGRCGKAYVEEAL